MLEIQRYLDMFDNANDGNDGLKEQYAIDVRKETLTAPSVGESSKRYPVFVYNYTKDSPMEIKMVQEARGLVLDDHANVVSSSFRYIPELNSHNASHIDWSSAMAEPQKDGELVVIYSYKRKWFIQTEESANAANGLPDCGISYKAYVSSILAERFGAKSPFKPFDDYLDDDLCYAFEFVSPYIRKVTPYRESDIILLSAFNKVSQEEKPFMWLHSFNHDFAGQKLRQVRRHVVNSFKDALRIMANMESTAKGIIVKDKFSNRLKMTNPKYKELKKIVDIGCGLTPKHIAKAVITGPAVHLGSINNAYNTVTNMFFDALVDVGKEIQEVWRENHYSTNDHFAKSIKNYPKITRSVLFMLKRGQAENIQEAFERMNPELVVKIAKKKYGAEFEEKFDEMIKIIKIWR